MNPAQRNRAIGLGVLGVVMLAVIYTQFFRGTPAPVAGAQPAAAPVQPGVAVQSVFENVELNVASLTENIQEVDFVYDTNQQARDPMMPLIGSSSLALNPTGEGPDVPSIQNDQLVYSANRKEVTGIMYDEKLPLAVIHTPGDGPEAGDQIANVGFVFGNGGIVVTEIGVNYVVLTVKIQNEEPVKITKALKEQ